MPDPDFIYKNSRFFENLLEHRFLFDLSRHLVLSDPPRLLNVLKSEVDSFGFDLVLAVAGRSLHVQMKTCSGAPPPNAYDLPESLWGYQDAAPSGCFTTRRPWSRSVITSSGCRYRPPKGFPCQGRGPAFAG